MLSPAEGVPSPPTCLGFLHLPPLPGLSKIPYFLRLYCNELLAFIDGFLVDLLLLRYYVLQTDKYFLAPLREGSDESLFSPASSRIPTFEPLHSPPFGEFKCIKLCWTVHIILFNFPSMGHLLAASSSMHQAEITGRDSRPMLTAIASCLTFPMHLAPLFVPIPPGPLAQVGPRA